MADKYKKHQEELAASGYRLPDSFYVASADPGESAEEKAGDGGQKAANAKQESEHGYDGELVEAEDVDAGRTVDPETGLTIPDAAEDQAQKAGATPSENKAAKKSAKR